MATTLSDSCDAGTRLVFRQMGSAGSPPIGSTVLEAIGVISWYGIESIKVAHQRTIPKGKLFDEWSVPSGLFFIKLAAAVQLLSSIFWSLLFKGYAF